MSNTKAGTIASRASQYEDIRALLRAGQNDEAIVRLCAIGIVSPDDLEAKGLLFDAFCQKRDWVPALVLAEQLAGAQPNDARLQKALIATLSNMKRYNDAIPKALQYIPGRSVQTPPGVVGQTPPPVKQDGDGLI